VDRLLWFVFAGSRGGPTRIRIMRLLLAKPLNANQLAKTLGLDYKTVEYNLRVLRKHVLVVQPAEGAYGATFRPSKNLLAARLEFDQISAALREPEPSPRASGDPTSGETQKYPQMEGGKP